MFWKKKKKKKEEKAVQAAIGKTEEFPEESGITVSFTGMGAKVRIGNAQHIGDRGGQEDSFGFSDLSSQEIIDSYWIFFQCYTTVFYGFIAA